MRLLGDLLDRSPEVNGVVAEEMSPSSSLSSSVFYSNQTGSDVELWQKAEEATQEIIAQVQPTVVSEERRKAFIDYVQRLLGYNLGCEVFPFGSVPLKTYLPDGDIDLTTFGSQKDEEALSKAVRSVLQVEEQNNASVFVVKDVQLIRAEVKIVKCLVQNIVVDVSFNQLGGLCTQCFLELVDRLIGKDHLFKRSIILIKAWCYYESRILGAHHGLISTYALETLILYIFNLFHSSLNGPLAVLYKFLDYFSKFDWDNYCISLNGLIRTSTWPEVAVETPDNGGADLLLSDDFLKDCLEMFAVPSRGAENNSSTFLLKHLNIVDPLKEINNLGRSVSKGNFYRIRSAFIYGARKLQRVLSQPEENIGNELRNFFLNTLDRHGRGQRPDVQGSIPMSRYRRLTATFPILSTELGQEDQMMCKPDSAKLSSMYVNCWLDHEDPLHKDIIIDRLGRETSNSSTFGEPQNSGNDSAGLENRLSGAAEDLATSRIQVLSISSDAPKSSSPNPQGNNPLFFKVPYTSHPFSSFPLGNGQVDRGWKLTENSSFNEEKESINNQEAFLPGSRLQPSSVNSSWSTQDLHPGSSGYSSSTSLSGNNEASTSLSDLCGDYDSHLNSLHYGRWCYDTLLNAPVSPMSSPRVPQVNNSWGVGRLPLQLRQNPIPPVNANGIIPRPRFLPVNSPFLHGAGFGKEELRKQRGTGTYIPNTNHYRDKFFLARGRNQAPVISPRSNGHRIMPFRETNSPERSSHELPQAYSNVRQGGGRFRSLDLRHSVSAENMYYPNANGSTQHLDRIEEFGSSLHVPSKPPTPDGGKQSNPVSPHSSNSSTPGTDKPDRITTQSLNLKDDDDFPPLSV